MKIIRVVLASVVLSGCAASEAQQTPQLLVSPPAKIQYSRDSPVYERVLLSKAEVLEVQKGVKAAMRDPASTNFGVIMGAKIKGAPGKHYTICGLVNSRNAHGGYAGMSPFLGDLVEGRFLFGGVAGSSLTFEGAMEICRERGMTV